MCSDPITAQLPRLGHLAGPAPGNSLADDAGSLESTSPLERLVLPELQLESAQVLRLVPVAYRTWGVLNEARDNAIVVCHALTGDTAADIWWSALVGPGKPIDTDRFFVVCANTLGSPYGSASPLTFNPETETAFAGAFPTVTVRDTVTAHRALLRHLGVHRVALALGASMGGMLALEWAFHRDLVRSFAVIAAGGRHSPWSIAWGEAQRQAIFADPNWLGGFYSPETPPSQGLSVARMMAMVSYRSPAEFQSRFGRSHNDAEFEVESYLHHHGTKLPQRFDANCYVSLTRQMDSHDVGRGRGGFEEALDSLPQPGLVVGIRSDMLYPLEEQVELASLLPSGYLEILSSPFGHDSFLVDENALNAAVLPFLNRFVYPYC